MFYAILLRVAALFTVYILLSVSDVASAQSTKFTEDKIVDISEFLSRTQDSLNLPGYTAILFENGDPVATFAEGVADKSGRSVTPDTPFQLASVSKNFSALVVLQLQQEGRLTLDDPVIKHLPDFKLRAGEPADAITIRNLIMHRSGLSTLDGNLYQFTTDRGDNAPAKALKKLQHTKLIAEPGTLHQYSNANYAVLANLIETIEQARFEDVMKRRVFDSLGLEACYIQVPENDSLKPAIGHRQWFGISRQREFVPGRKMMSAGGVVCSANDLMAYIIALAERDPRLLDEQGYEIFLDTEIADRPEIYSYELGWIIVGSGETRYLTHTGLNGGFQAIAAFYPESATGFFFMSNVSSYTHGSLQSILRQKIMDEVETPDLVKPTSMPILYTGAGLVFGLLILFVWLSLRLLRQNHLARKTWLGFSLKTAVPAIILAGLSYATIIALPQMNGTNLRSMFVFFPDIALCLLLIGTFSGLSATALILKRVKS